MTPDTGNSFSYARKFFDPHAPTAGTRREAPNAVARLIPAGGFSFPEEAVLAVNVAIASNRPLLVRGEPGSGKSTLAPAVAMAARWDYLEHTVTSRTTARDLLWSFDNLRRLRDAQANRDVDNPRLYITPGVFWRALDPAAAGLLAAPAKPNSTRTVVLIDEIDKADPDVPNDLLGLFGTLSFEVGDLLDASGRPEKVQNTYDEPPLVVVTTNEERDLPPAFERRCVVLTLPFPATEKLVEIAYLHFPGDEDGHGGDARDRVDRDWLYRTLAEIVKSERKKALDHGARLPGTAEYIDAVKACRELGVSPEYSDGPSSAGWAGVRFSTIAKWDDPRKRRP